VPRFEDSASDCFNRASQIARSLNHINLSADHLMLALTMDPNARRLLERVGDVVQLREAATQRLGRMNSRFSRTSGEQALSPTSDLADIGKKARETAAEREQLVAISDLINAFPKANGRLTYVSGEDSRAVALIESIEKGLVPRVTESMTRIEAAVRCHATPAPVGAIHSARPQRETRAGGRPASARFHGRDPPADA
jgi:ATP-dependent Clp protease ATP-binding subunit ClpA